MSHNVFHKHTRRELFVLIRIVINHLETVELTENIVSDFYFNYSNFLST